MVVIDLECSPICSIGFVRTANEEFIAEGIACGCRAIVVASAGLVEAIGELAVMFEGENPVSLAHAIERTLTEEFDGRSIGDCPTISFTASRRAQLPENISMF